LGAAGAADRCITFWLWALRAWVQEDAA